MCSICFEPQLCSCVKLNWGASGFCGIKKVKRVTSILTCDLTGQLSCVFFKTSNLLLRLHNLSLGKGHNPSGSTGSKCPLRACSAMQSIRGFFRAWRPSWRRQSCFFRTLGSFPNFSFIGNLNFFPIERALAIGPIRGGHLKSRQLGFWGPTRVPYRSLLMLLLPVWHR